MTLRTKAIVIISIALLLMVGLIYSASRIIFMRGIEEIEEHDTSENVEQVLGAFSYLISDLEGDTADWSAWDDTYAFIEDGNDEYIKSNLVDGTFISLKLNLMLFVHSSGQIVFGKAFDLENEEEIPLPPDLLAQLSENNLLLSQADTYSYTSGIILLKEGPMLIASQPILTSEDKGPARGTLIFARYLDSQIVNELSQLTLFPITIRPVNNLAYQDCKEALSALSADEPIFVKPTSKQYISGYTLLNDIYGKPALMLRVDVPRDAYQLGQLTTSYYILSVLGAGLLISVITMFLIQKQVLSRFTSLIRGINRIATSGDTSTRLSIGGRDELSVVAGTINGMLAALQETTTQIRESEERYSDLFENAAELIHSVAVDGHFLYVNEAWRKTLGYSQEEVAKLSLWDIIHPDYLAYYREVFQKVISGETLNVEADFVTKDGKRITVRGNISCRFKNGTAVGTRGIFHDVTERKQAEEKLQQLYQQERALRQQLEEEVQKRVEFTRALIHELRTPITPVLAATELLLEEIKDERSLRLVQSISRSASNLNRRIDELIDLIRGETDMLRLNIEPVDIVSLLKDIGYEVMPIALRNGHSLTVDLPASSPIVPADTDRLRQIIMNLLNNAFKFTPKEGEITLRAREDEANLIVEVQDTGPGISQEEQKRLFQPYYRRVDDRERLSGLGLGLSIAKKLVELHGGRIWVKSQKGKGSTFGFSLPLETTSQREGQINKEES